jgi:hypothetical protein
VEFDCSDLEIQEPRFYMVEGRRFPSVTTILSIIANPHLERWRGEIGNEAADRISNLASQFGTDVHDLTALADQGMMLDPPPDMESLCHQWKYWVESNVKEFLMVEETVYSMKWGFAGTLDRSALLRTGELAILDIKTGRLKKEIGMQLIAYGMAHEEMGKGRIERRIAVCLNRKTRKLELKPYEDPADREAFLWALGLWRYLRG